MTVHDSFATTIKSLIGRYGQDNISFVRDGEDTGPEWDPQPGEPTVTQIGAWAKGVSAKYVDETVSATDLMVAAEPWGVEPTLADRIRIGSADKEIIKVKRIPAAGTVTAWIIFVKS